MIKKFKNRDGYYAIKEDGFVSLYKTLHIKQTFEYIENGKKMRLYYPDEREVVEVELSREYDLTSAIPRTEERYFYSSEKLVIQIPYNGPMNSEEFYKLVESLESIYLDGFKDGKEELQNNIKSLLDISK